MRKDWDQALEQMVCIRAACMARRLGLNATDRDDLRQDLRVQLLRALPRYDAARASPSTFASRVLDKACLHCMRQIMGQQRRASAARAELAHQHRRTEGGADHAWEQREDLREVSHLLPDRLGYLFGHLARQSPRQAAKVLGVHHSRVYRDLEAIRSLAEGWTS